MKRFCGILVLAVLVLLAGCRRQGEHVRQGAVEQRPESFGDMLIIGAVSEPLNLIPLLAADTASQEIAGLIYNGLVKFDKDLNLVGDLAERWYISEDGRNITFHLKEDVYWHDGQQFTAADIVFTYNFIVSPGAPVSYDADEFKEITGVFALDKYTVTVEYARPTPDAALGWMVWIMPRHLLDGVPVTKSAFQKKPVGTGPYAFKQWTPGESLTLTANDRYFGGRPNIAAVEYRFFSEQDDAFTAMLLGDVDMLRLTPLQFIAYEGDDFIKYSYKTLSYSYLNYNTMKDPLSGKAARQALSLALNRQAIVDDIYKGKGDVADSPYVSYWRNDKVSPLLYDPAQAGNILSSDGWKRNAAGKLVKNGKTFKIILMTNKNPSRVSAAGMIKADWEALGVDVSLSVLEWGAFLSALSRGNFDVALLDLNMPQDPDFIDLWHSARCGAPDGLNFGCYRNEEADSLLEKAGAEMDAAKRKADYDRLQEILADERPYTFLYTADALWAVSSRVKGIEPSAAGIMYNFTGWYVPPEEHRYNINE